MHFTTINLRKLTLNNEDQFVLFLEFYKSVIRLKTTIQTYVLFILFTVLDNDINIL